MPWVKLNKLLTPLLLVLFSSLFFLTRVPRLGTEENNPDGVNWYERSERFIVAVKEHRWFDTYQSYHPGVTLMWVVGSTIELIKHFVPGNTAITKDTFPLFHFYSKFVLILVQFFLTLLAIWAVRFMVGLPKALLFFTLFSLEPFLLGNSRIIHIDVLVTLFLLLGFSFSYLVISGIKPLKYATFSGVFLSLAFLSKSIGIIGLPFVLVCGGWVLYKQQSAKAAWQFVGILFGSYLVTLLLFFPALWVSPLFVIKEIFRESERVGGREGHGQIVFGEYTRDPGLFFYFLVLGLKTSLVSLVGLLLYLAAKIKRVKLQNLFTHTVSFYLYYGLFSLAYILVMSVLSKKIDRYSIVALPVICMMAIEGFYVVGTWLRTYHSAWSKLYYVFVAGLAALFLFVPLISFFPYYFTFTNILGGTPENANTIVAQKPFGIGVFGLKYYISSVYGNRFGAYPVLGFYDPKPMRSIYMGSRIFDLQLADPAKADLIILGPNEVFPTDPIDRSKLFKLDYTYKINGLDFWRIYVKKS